MPQSGMRTHDRASVNEKICQLFTMLMVPQTRISHPSACTCTQASPISAHTHNALRVLFEPHFFSHSMHNLLQARRFVWLDATRRDTTRAHAYTHTQSRSLAIQQQPQQLRLTTCMYNVQYTYKTHEQVNKAREYWKMRSYLTVSYHILIKNL